MITTMDMKSRRTMKGSIFNVTIRTALIVISLIGLLHQIIRQSTPSLFSYIMYPTSSCTSDIPAQTTSHEQFSLASEESLGVFDDIPDQDWELMRNITMGRVNNANPMNPLESSHKANHWYQRNWDPDFSCRHETKIGVGDGGKVCKWTKRKDSSTKEITTIAATTYSFF
jgi:hypothetical protein